jgi:hypothetical protein
MARVAINTGATPNDGTGDNLRSAGGIINDNFLEIYSYLGAGSTSNLTAPMWSATATGINTTRNVGIGTTNPRFLLEVGAVGASGTSLYVNGNARITGIVTIGTSSITLNGTTNKINVGSGVTIDGATGTINASAITIGGTSISVGAGVTYITAGTGISVNQSSGNVTITATGGGGFSGVATSVDIINTNGLTTIYYPTFVEDRTTAQYVRADVDLTYRTDTNTLTVPNISVESISANQFYGDGSGLTGIVATGSGVVIEDSGSPIGTAATINFGNNLEATISNGVATINASGSGGSGISTQWVSTAAGIHTLSNVGIGTTNPTSALTVKGNTSLETLNVSGIATISGDGTNAYLRYGSTNAYTNFVTTYGVSQVSGVSLISADANGAALSANTALNAGYWRVRTLSTGAEVNGNLTISGPTGGGLSVSGIATIGPVATGTTSLYLGGPLKVGEIDISGGSTSVHVGQGAGRKNYNGGSGQQNTAVGYNALGVNQASNFNTAFGISALGSLGDTAFSNYDANTAIGAYAGSSLLTGINNTFLGRSAGSSITSGSSNTILGMYDGNSGGLDIRTSSNNVVLSDGAGNIRLIANAAGNIGLGTTNPTSALTVKGNTSLETLNVSGVSTFSGTSNFGTLNAQTINVNTGGMNVADGIPIYFGNAAQGYISYGSGLFQIRGPGGTTPLILGAGPTAGANVRITSGDGNSNYAVFSGTGVTVTGTTFTDQLSVSGISTLSSNVSVGGTISVDGGVKLATNNTTIVGTSGTVGEIKRIGGAPFFYDGSAWREFVLSAGTPVSVPADTEWDSVVFRATFDTDYTDAKFGATPIVVSAGSSIVGSAVTIGTGAYRNDNSFGNAGLTYPYRSEYDFTGSWTFETWIYFDNTAENHTVSIFAITNSNTSGQLALFASTDIYSNKYFQWANENGTNQIVYSTSGAAFNSIFNQKWNHIALVRESSNGSLHFYLNGVESNNTYLNAVIDNNIINVNNNQLNIGGTPNHGTITINGVSINTTGGSATSIDAIYDDVRISAGVGTAGQRYTSIGTASTTTFTPPRTALPTTGTLSSYIQPPADKYGEIGLGTSPTWRGTSGVTVSQQSSGNYRVTFASSYTNRNDYYVLSQGMDQGFASYVGIARSTTHVDLSINRQSNDAAVDTGSLSVQIKNHI